MLGNGTGKISQAFLVEALLTHISSPRGIWYFDPFIEDVNKEMLTKMKNEIFCYLFAVEKVFDEVWGITESIIHNQKNYRYGSFDTFNGVYPLFR